jgi:hypothetical protein
MFHIRSESTSARRDPEKVRQLARDRGYTAERSIRRNHWELTAADGTRVIDPKTQTPAFSWDDVVAFLKGPGHQTKRRRK